MTAYERAISQIQSNLGGSISSQVLNSDALRNRVRLVYNAGIARESYFRSTGDSFASRAGLWKILQTDAQGNSPFYVSAASKLWSAGIPYKGMITTSYHREAAPSTDDKVAAKSGNLVLPTVGADGINYGFQFHYNPGSVSMDYGAAPPQDITLQTSGREKYNTYGPRSGTGTISFQLILNRVNDMKYFDVKTQKLKAGVQRGAFTGRLPDNRELSDIYNRGTMYDMEFLFRTLLGFQHESALGRGMSWDNKTADLGFLGAKPVELHLGKSLRYLGRVTGIQINHVLFTERMVPMFSEVGITFQRLFDPAPSSNTPRAVRIKEPPRITGIFAEPQGTSATVTVAGG